MINALTIDAANEALEFLGAEAGRGATSMIEQAETLFKFAEVLSSKHGKDAANEAYRVYASALNAADTRGAKQVDLGNAKSLKAQVAKFNVFIKLGSVERDARRDFIANACELWAGGPDKRPSMYDALLTACRAQVAAGKLMSDEEVYDAMFPAREEKTRIDGLEAIAANLAKHIEKWKGEDAIAGSHALQALNHLASAIADAKKASLN